MSWFESRVLLLSFLVAVSGCKHVSEPPVVKNPREYTWTIDTLAYPNSFQTSMRDIWGSSANDVYVVGHNDAGGYGKMYHYDGNRWRPVDLAFGAFDLSAIYGFSANDIWAVGNRFFYNPNPPPNFLDSSLIIHYDGAKWSEHKVSGGRNLLCIWGASPADVWVGGQYGTLFHFDGSSWGKTPLAPTIHIGSLWGFASNDIYATAARTIDKVQPLDSSEYLLLHYDGIQCSVIDSFIEYPGYSGDKFGYSDLWGPSPSSLYSVSQGVFKKRGDSWERVLNTGSPFYGVFGSSSSNIFAVGMRSQVYHFNGTDWFRFPQFKGEDRFFSSLWTDGEQVFVVGNVIGAGYATITLILHGK